MSGVERLIGGNGYTAVVAAIKNLPNGAGSGSAPVTVVIDNLIDSFGVGQLDPTGAYTVQVTPSQACAVSVSGKNSAGFSVTLTPLSGSIAVGTIDILVHT